MEHIDCPHAARCAGCPAIALDYATQLERKHARVRVALARYGSLGDIEVRPTEGAAAVTDYRVRAKLVVAPGPRLGLYARDGGHQVVDIPGCRVLRPALVIAAQALRELLADPPADAAAALTPASKVRGGALRGVDLREALDESGEARVMLTLILDRAARVPSEVLRAAARHIVERAPRVVTVAASRQLEQSPQLLGEAPTLVWGEPLVPDESGSGLGLAASGGFVQAHRGQAARIHQQLAGELTALLGTLKGKHVVDAYAGSGAIGLGLAALGARVTLIESFAPALQAAERAAAARKLAVHTVTGDAGAELRAMLRARKRVDAIVVNPPRRGLSPAVRLACAELAPKALAYVSCEPDTLGRDLGDFARLGLRASEITPFDMMPLTDEVETLAVLRPQPPVAPTLLFVAEDLLAVDKPAHEPVVAERPGERALLSRLAALGRRGIDRAAPLFKLDAELSGICLLALLPGPRAEVRKEYVALCRGIIRPEGAVGGGARGEAGAAKPAADSVKRAAGGAKRGNVARTHYRRLEVVGGHSLVRATIDHGRVEQLRRHLATIGHPVLGDARYGHAPSNRHMAEKVGLDRPFLHCARVVLAQAEAGEPLVIESPLAGDLQMVLDRLRGAALQIP